MRKVLKANMFRMKIENFADGQLFVYFQQFVYFSQISHLEALSTKTAPAPAHNTNFANLSVQGSPKKSFPSLDICHCSC